MSGNNKPLHADIGLPLKLRPFFRFLPEVQRVDALREEAINSWYFTAILAGQSPFDRPWLEAPFKMYKCAEGGDIESARAIVELACQASQWVKSLESSNPEMMSALARQRAIWPVIGSYDSSWDKGITKRLLALGLGQGRQDVLPNFREAQGDEEKLPARRWAREAIRCVIITRAMQKKLPQIKEQEAENIRQGKLLIETAPAWAFRTKQLPDYSARNLPVWRTFIREVIRQQIPDFHLRPEWKACRENCKTANHKPSKSDIQNAILDDVAAALKTITPAEMTANL